MYSLNRKEEQWRGFWTGEEKVKLAMDYRELKRKYNKTFDKRHDNFRSNVIEGKTASSTYTKKELSTPRACRSKMLKSLSGIGKEGGPFIKSVVLKFRRGRTDFYLDKSNKNQCYPGLV